MEQQTQSSPRPPAASGGVTTSASQHSYTVTGAISPAIMDSANQFSNQQQLAAYQQVQQFHHQQQQHQSQQLRGFWADQMAEVEQAADFKNHSLPLARIKKIMKADEDVRMISAEAPVVFAKACEMFILELTLRAWIHTEENKRRTLQKNDIAAAITRTDIYDFLVDIVPRDDGVRGDQEGAGVQMPRATLQSMGGGEAAAYQYVPVPGGMIPAAAMYGQQPLYLWGQPPQVQQQQPADSGQEEH